MVETAFVADSVEDVEASTTTTEVNVDFSPLEPVTVRVSLEVVMAVAWEVEVESVVEPWLELDEVDEALLLSFELDEVDPELVGVGEGVLLVGVGVDDDAGVLVVLVMVVDAGVFEVVDTGDRKSVV